MVVKLGAPCGVGSFTERAEGSTVLRKFSPKAGGVVIRLLLRVTI
jgi:hypothetical protein